MAYATVEDLQARMTRELTADEKAICVTLLEDAAVIIDAFNDKAADDAKLVVSCNMIKRAIASADAGVPIGATQGSMSGLGYAQSWTMGTNASVGEMYLARLDKKLLGAGNAIGSYSPVEERKHGFLHELWRMWWK